MRRSNATLTKPLIALVLLSAVLMVAVQVVEADPGHRVLEDRAERLYTYDRSHPNALPAHRLRALSLALKFRDDKGAEHIVRTLEQALN